MNEQKEFNLNEIISQMYDFADYSPEEKEKLVNETSTMIMEVSLLEALNVEGEEIQQKFNDLLLTEPSDDVVTQFIAEKLPSFNTILLKEIEKLQKNLNADTTD